jgi:hypothetical protein
MSKIKGNEDAVEVSSVLGIDVSRHTSQKMYFFNAIDKTLVNLTF